MTTPTNSPTFDVATAVAAVSATIAFGSAIVSFLQARKSSKSAAESVSIERGNLMLTMRAAITGARQHAETAGMAVGAEFDVAKPDRKKQLQAYWMSATENHLNQFEVACSHYLAGRVQVDDFKREYRNEITTICDPHMASFARLMHPEDQSDYRNIWRVYHEWFGRPTPHS